MIKYKSDNNIYKILFVISIIGLFCIIAFIIYLKYLLCSKCGIDESLAAILAAVIITAYVGWAFVILPMWYRSLFCLVSDEGIELHSGVLFEKISYVRFSKIQYTEREIWTIFPKNNVNNLLIQVGGKRLKMKFLSLSDLSELENRILIGWEKQGEIK